MDYPVVEHGRSRPGRWLRANRTRLALLLALAEGALVVVGRLSLLLALALAVGVIAFHLLVGRSLRGDALRQASGVAALSQLLVVAAPLLVLALGAVAVLAVGLVAVVAIVVLVARRR